MLQLKIVWIVWTKVQMWRIKASGSGPGGWTQIWRRRIKKRKRERCKKVSRVKLDSGRPPVTWMMHLTVHYWLIHWLFIFMFSADLSAAESYRIVQLNLIHSNFNWTGNVILIIQMSWWREGFWFQCQRGGRSPVTWTWRTWLLTCYNLRILFLICILKAAENEFNGKFSFLVLFFCLIHSNLMKLCGNFVYWMAFDGNQSWWLQRRRRGRPPLTWLAAPDCTPGWVRFCLLVTWRMRTHLRFTWRSFWPGAALPREAIHQKQKNNAKEIYFLSNQLPLCSATLFTLFLDFVTTL